MNKMQVVLEPLLVSQWFAYKFVSLIAFIANGTN